MGLGEYRRLLQIAAILTLQVLLVGEVSAGATSATWDASSGTDWHTNSNWQRNGFVGGTGAPNSSLDALISTTGSGTISIGSSNASAQSLQLLSSANKNWTINGSATLTLDTDDSTGYTVYNQSSYNLTINSNLNLTNSSAPGGQDSKFYAQNGNITVNGNINFNAVNPYIDANSGRTVTFNGVLSGASSVTKVGAGAWVIGGSGGNTYSGSTIINSGQVTLQKTSGNAIAGSSIVLNGGSLVFGGSNQIGNSTNLTLAGGNVFLNDYSDTLGSLTLSSASTINLGSDEADGSVLRFGNSSGNAWSGGDLYITGWNGSLSGGGLDQIFFGNNASGLTSSQLGTIYFVNPGDWTGVFAAQILSSGEIVPVPEPGTYAAGGGLLLCLLVFECRRRRKVTAPISGH